MQLILELGPYSQHFFGGERGEGVSQGQKSAYTGFTQTIAVVPPKPDISRRVSHPSIILAQFHLTSVFEWELVYPTW